MAFKTNTKPLFVFFFFIFGLLFSSIPKVSFAEVNGLVPIEPTEKIAEELSDLIGSLQPLVTDPGRTNRDISFSAFGTCLGRLTLESGVPISTTDQTSKGTLYFTPFNGSRIAVYDGSKWILRNFSEISLALTLTTNTNYDVFAYDNAGTLTLELSSAWTDDTTRNNALTTLNGIYVKSAATTRRYIGTIRASAANLTEDSVLKRFVWNYHNRRMRHLYVTDTTDTWTDSTATTWRQANNSSSNRLRVVLGMDDPVLRATVRGESTGAADDHAQGVGIDQTTGNDATLMGATNFATPHAADRAEYSGRPGLGFHYVQWLEIVTSSLTFCGDNGTSTSSQSGMIAWVEG